MVRIVLFLVTLAVLIGIDHKDAAAGVVLWFLIESGIKFATPFAAPPSEIKPKESSSSVHL